MCLGIPMQIKELNPPLAAWVETHGVRRLVSTVLVAHEDLKPGDWVIIHIGSAIGKIDEIEAGKTLSLLEELSASPQPSSAESL